MGDLGAEVIKIERPKGGDDARHWGPPFLTRRSGDETLEAAYFMCANRGKKSVTVDISQHQGQTLIKALAARCDVMIENYKVGDLARYGGEFMAAARAFGKRISRHPPQVMRLIKRLLRERQHVSLRTSLELSSAFQALTRYT